MRIISLVMIRKTMLLLSVLPLSKFFLCDGEIDERYATKEVDIDCDDKEKRRKKMTRTMTMIIMLPH